MVSPTAASTIDVPPLVVSATSVNAGCGCTGSATVSASGSIAGYTYFWTPAPGAGQGTNHATNMCAGTYSCIVTSSIGCADTVVVTIASGGSMTANVTGTNVNCFGNATASSCRGSSLHKLSHHYRRVSEYPISGNQQDGIAANR